MLKRIAIACACSFLTLQAFAQKQSYDSVSTYYKWEAGTDLLWLINKHNLPATTVFIRHHFDRLNRMPSAIRVRLGFGLDGRDVRPYHGTQVVDYYDGFSPYLRAGYEWHVPKGNLQLYYGADALLAYWVKNTHDVTWVDYNQPNGEMWEMTTHAKEFQWNRGIIGFAGVKYFLSPQISLSAEASYDLIQTIHEYKEKSFLKQHPSTNMGGSRKTTSWHGHFRPLSVINFSFHF